MTKRDFRMRRGLFRGQIRNHRDFDSFQSAYNNRKGKDRLGKIVVMILIGLGLALVVYFMFIMQAANP